MASEDDLPNMLARARAGDEEAIRDFLTKFEWEVRMMVRARLPKKLRTQFDSVDFVQAVWQSFFSDLGRDTPDFEKAEHVRRFLAGVVRNKVFEQHRKLTRTEKYDVSREERLYIRRGDQDVPRDVVSPDPSPSEAAQADDRLAQLTEGRSPQEVEVISLRRLGLTFDEVAARTGVHERTVRRIIESARADGGPAMTLPCPASSGADALNCQSDVPSSREWRIACELGEPSDPESGSTGLASVPACSLERGDSKKLIAVLDEFTAAWEQGAAPGVEDYLSRLDPGDIRGKVELIYREFCLAEAAGTAPKPAAYFSRFPEHAQALEGLLALHAACTPSLLGRCVESAGPASALPKAGDVIGPYVLRRELGRGSFARVFLAQQADLEDRLVVLKVSSRLTREPWLMARVRHAHIVEIMSHAVVDDGAFQLICMPFWGGATLTALFAVGRQREDRPAHGVDLLTDLDSVAAPEYPAVHPARPAREVLAGLSYEQAWAWIGARLAEALDHAFNRDVVHGDVKPSNVLLSADGNPMLLDFNLARTIARALAGETALTWEGPSPTWRLSGCRRWLQPVRAASQPTPASSTIAPTTVLNRWRGRAKTLG